MSSNPSQNCPEPARLRPLVEWQTLAMAALCYFGIGVILIWGPGAGLMASCVVLSIFIALHSSLQHEVLHGHPFRSQSLSEALVFPAVGLFIPYQRFRDTHLQHHYDPNLTDPYDDPESNYMDPDVWARTPVLLRVLYRFNNTLLGRMLVGPGFALVKFYKDDGAAILNGDRVCAKAYALHVLGVIPVAWVVQMSSIPLWVYTLAAYFGLSLLKIRTFLEHRAHEKVPGRTVIIESRGPLSYLFLNNNYHSVHHAHPGLAWYQLPRAFEERRDQFLERNQAYYYRSYVEIFRDYFLTPKDPVPHPLMESVRREKVLEHQ